MAFAAQPVDFNYFLARKYALQQQEANATTANAASGRIQADANALVAGTVAKQNTVQTSLMPAESASQNALRAAQALLAGTQARLMPAESAANIAQTQAQTRLTGFQGDAVKRNELTPARTVWGGAGTTGALGRVMGSSMFRFSPTAPLPGRAPGESEAAYLDRINGL